MFVRIAKYHGEEVLIPRETFEFLNLEELKEYTFVVGLRKERRTIRPSYEKRNFIYFPKSCFDQLLLFSEIELNIWRINNALYLGPVVGIFVNPRYIQSIVDNRSPLSAVKNIQANQVGRTFLYFFSIDQMNWLEKKVGGVVYAPRWNTWKKYWVPLPNVVYDRGVYFRDEEKALSNQIREQFQKHKQIHLINSKHYLGKWQLYRDLSKYSTVYDMLPKTIPYEDFEDVLRMLETYQLIYLKSWFGSKGKEVMAIEKQGIRYMLNFYDNAKKKIFVSFIKELKQYVEDFIRDKPFIIQEGIHLIQYKGQRMDMRVLLEKDGLGNWQAIYNQVRVAAGDSMITNASLGGAVYNYTDVYPDLLADYGSIATDIEVRKAAITVAYIIEKEYGSFGEIGMDMAIDQQGKIWLIEANAKPNKKPEPGLEDTEGISPQFLSVLEYAKFLVKENGDSNDY